jgi:hypothetical protein
MDHKSGVKPDLIFYDKKMAPNISENVVAPYI